MMRAEKADGKGHANSVRNHWLAYSTGATVLACCTTEKNSGAVLEALAKTQRHCCAVAVWWLELTHGKARQPRCTPGLARLPAVALHRVQHYSALMDCREWASWILACRWLDSAGK